MLLDRHVMKSLLQIFFAEDILEAAFEHDLLLIHELSLRNLKSQLVDSVLEVAAQKRGIAFFDLAVNKHLSHEFVLVHKEVVHGAPMLDGLADFGKLVLDVDELVLFGLLDLPLRFLQDLDHVWGLIHNILN